MARANYSIIMHLPYNYVITRSLSRYRTLISTRQQAVYYSVKRVRIIAFDDINTLSRVNTFRKQTRPSPLLSGVSPQEKSTFPCFAPRFSFGKVTSLIEGLVKTNETNRFEFKFLLIRRVDRATFAGY